MICIDDTLLCSVCVCYYCNEQRERIQKSEFFLWDSCNTLSLLIMNNNNNDIDDDENTNNTTHHHHQQRQRQKEKLIRNRVLADSIKIAELEAKEHDGVSLSPQAASVLGELVFLESEKLAFDLKAFAKHRNDRTITKKDVELFVRRSSGDLLECIEDALRKENVIWRELMSSIEIVRVEKSNQNLLE